MRKQRIVLWLAGTLAILLGLAFGYYYIILDWTGRPCCHKGIMLSFYTWMDDHGMDVNSHTNDFPNVNGKSAESLAAIREQMGGHMRWASGYRYVAGLREDDPGDLVLLYVDRPTRWTWHGHPPTIFKRKAWLVVPVDFAMVRRPVSGGGELSERVSREAFRRRLRRTLDFVRTHERPYWQTIVAEHAKLLESLEQADR